MYDDAGTGFGHERGRSTRTTFVQRRRGDTVTLRIGRARGDFPGALRARTWDVSVRDVDRPRVVSVDGRRTTRWSWDRASRTLRVVLERVPSDAGARLRVR